MVIPSIPAYSIFLQDFGGRSIDSSDAKEMIKLYLNDVGREISDRVYFTEEEVGA